MKTLKFYGPMKLLPSDSTVPLLFEDKNAWLPGIYFWIFPVNSFYKINYVGITTKSISARQIQHVSNFLQGKYLYYEHTELQNGILTRAYHPNDGLDKHITAINKLFAYLNIMQIIFAPLDEDKKTLELIESAIIKHLRDSDSKIYEWLDNAGLSRNHVDNTYHVGLKVVIECPISIDGLPNEILI